MPRASQPCWIDDERQHRAGTDAQEDQREPDEAGRPERRIDRLRIRLLVEHRLDDIRRFTERLTDGEGIGPAHRVRVRRDHPPRDHVRPVRKPVAEADRDGVRRRFPDVPGVDATDVSVEDPHRPWDGRYRLVEPEHHLLGRVMEHGPFRRSRLGQARMSKRRRRRNQRRDTHARHDNAAATPLSESRDQGLSFLARQSRRRAAARQTATSEEPAGRATRTQARAQQRREHRHGSRAA